MIDYCILLQLRYTTDPCPFRFVKKNSTHEDTKIRWFVMVYDHVPSLNCHNLGVNASFSDAPKFISSWLQIRKHFPTYIPTTFPLHPQLTTSPSQYIPLYSQVCISFCRCIYISPYPKIISQYIQILSRLIVEGNMCTCTKP